MDFTELVTWCGNSDLPFAPVVLRMLGYSMWGESMAADQSLCLQCFVAPRTFSLLGCLLLVRDAAAILSECHGPSMAVDDESGAPHVRAAALSAANRSSLRSARNFRCNSELQLRLYVQGDRDQAKC